MQVAVESGEGLERRLLVDLPADLVTAAMDKKLKDIARNVRLDGFRPGKVPMRTVRQRYGDQVRRETYSALIQETLYEAASQEQLMPAGEPKIELRDAAEEGGFGYTAIFEVMPKVEIADLAGQKIDRPIAEVGDGDIDAMIEKLRKQRTVWDDVQRAAQDGDTLHLDFTGYIDGEAFDGGSGENVPLILGSGSMIEGFEAGLEGANGGDSRTLEVKFPEDYGAKHLAGKEATFEVKVLRVTEPRLPDVDEEFVKALGVEDGTLEGLRENVAKNMRHELKRKLQSQTKERVMEMLLTANPVEIPKALVTQECERMRTQMLQELQQQQGGSSGVDLPVTLFEEEAGRRVRLGLLVAEIIDREKLEVQEDRLRETIAEFADSYENPQEVVNYYLQDATARKSVENLVLENAVVEWVLGQIEINDESKSFAEMMENKA